MRAKGLRIFVFLAAVLFAAYAGYTDAQADSHPVILCSGLPDSEDNPSLLYSRETRDAVYLINLKRQEAGLSPLRSADILEQAALIRAGEVGERFSHFRPDGKPYYTVAPEFIYGELLAVGYQSAEDVVMAWMRSDNHKACLLDPSYTNVGVVLQEFHGGVYWVVEFGC